jgi:hypothetical protein
MAKLVELIETDDLRGEGTPSDPCRRVRQWFTKAGVLVVESDPHAVVGAAEILNRLPTHSEAAIEFGGIDLKELRLVLGAMVGR